MRIFSALKNLFSRERKAGFFEKVESDLEDDEQSRRYERYLDNGVCRYCSFIDDCLFEKDNM